MVTSAFPPAANVLREPDAPVNTYLGSYMPFAGVKCYRLFNDIDLALGRGKIGPIGWHRENLTTNDSASVESEVLAPA